MLHNIIPKEFSKLKSGMSETDNVHAEINLHRIGHSRKYYKTGCYFFLIKQECWVK
jgi:hypothetical protein